MTAIVRSLPRDGCGYDAYDNCSLPTILSDATPVGYAKNRKRPAME